MRVHKGMNLFVVATVVAAAIFLFWLYRSRDQRREQACRRDMVVVLQQCRAFHQRYQSWPNFASEVESMMGVRLPLDPWGTEYFFETEDGGFWIRSVGTDRATGMAPGSDWGGDFLLSSAGWFMNAEGEWERLVVVGE